MGKKNEEKPDWSRFEQAIDIALKTPAKHKIASRKKKKISTKKQPRD